MLTLNEILQLRPKPETYRASKHDDMICSGTAIQDKLDGWRMTVIRFEGDDVQIIGRKRYINYWALLKHDVRLYHRILSLPPNTVLDGEYHNPECDSTDVPTMMRECSGDFTPWAIPWLNGKCIMSKSLPHANLALMSLGWDPPSICPMKSLSVEDLMHEAERQGVEGYVLKTSQWDLGSWIKVKPTRTFDLVVTSVVLGGVRGGIKSLCVSTRDGVEVGKVGGLSDEMRCRDDLIGRVVEVRAQDVTKDGRLKFARLVRFRTDKDSTNTFEEIKG